MAMSRAEPAPIITHTQRGVVGSSVACGSGCGAGNGFASVVKVNTRLGSLGAG